MKGLSVAQRSLLKEVRRQGGIYVRAHKVRTARSLAKLGFVMLRDDGYLRGDGERWWVIPWVLPAVTEGQR